MKSPEPAEYRPQAPRPKIFPRFRSLEDMVAHCAHEAFSDAPITDWRTRRDPRNDGALHTWAGGDRWLWKIAHELHEYDLAARDVPERRRHARAEAKRIIEGRTRWPAQLLAWKRFTELTYSRLDGSFEIRRGLPPWLQEKNLPPPQRARVKARAAEIMADIAREARP